MKSNKLLEIGKKITYKFAETELTNKRHTESEQGSNSRTQKRKVGEQQKTRDQALHKQKEGIGRLTRHSRVPPKCQKEVEMPQMAGSSPHTPGLPSPKTSSQRLTRPGYWRD
jgi:hypothetical protein